MYVVRIRVWIWVMSAVCIADSDTAVHTGSCVYNIILCEHLQKMRPIGSFPWKQT